MANAVKVSIGGNYQPLIKISPTLCRKSISAFYFRVDGVSNRLVNINVLLNVCIVAIVNHNIWNAKDVQDSREERNVVLGLTLDK